VAYFLGHPVYSMLVGMLKTLDNGNYILVDWRPW